MNKYSVLICVFISVLFLVIATLIYPGGSILDKNSTGFDWSKNFFSNLFLEKALNVLEELLEDNNPEIRLKAADIIVQHHKLNE